MLNQVILVGRISDIEEDIITLLTDEQHIPIVLESNLSEKTLNLIKIGQEIGVNAKVVIDDLDTITLLVNKITIFNK